MIHASIAPHFFHISSHVRILLHYTTFFAYSLQNPTTPPHPYFIYIIFKFQKQTKEKNQGKREIRSEKKENKLGNIFLPPSSLPSTLSSITIHIIWECNYHKWYLLCFSIYFVYLHICFYPRYSLRNSIFLFPSATSHVASQIYESFWIALFTGGRRAEGHSNTLSSLHFEGRSDVSMERVRNYICSWESGDLFIPIASNLRYAHLDHNWGLDSSISRWALP